MDADGWRSEQTDVIVFDRQYSPPLFMAGNVQYIPAEAVYAVFEVKQRIDNRNLRLACDKAASVRLLRRTSAVIPSADGTLDPMPPHRIISEILALSNSYSSNFVEALGGMMAQVHEERQLDLGCALKRWFVPGQVQGRRGRQRRIKPRFVVPGQLFVPVASGPAGYRDCACHRLFGPC